MNARTPKERTKEYNERVAESLLKTWSGLAEIDLRTITKGEIIIRGDSETGTKNREMRRVPMIPQMRGLLERLKEKRPEEAFLKSPVCAVRKFNCSLKNACKKLGLHHLTHRGLHHLFATRCIESSVPIPGVHFWNCSEISSLPIYRSRVNIGPVEYLGNAYVKRKN